MLQITINFLYLLAALQLAAECRVFGENSTAEFHKLHRGIWQNLQRKNGGPAYSHFNGHFPSLPRLASCLLEGFERIFYRLVAIANNNLTWTNYTTTNLTRERYPSLCGR